MSIQIAYYTAQGSRESNQDRILTRYTEKTALAVVADGLGGMSFGEIAAQVAVTTLDEKLGGIPMDEQQLFSALFHVNRRILAQQIPGKSMYTTVALLWLEGNNCIAAHIGDSRIYQFRNGKIVYQSTDHSVSQMELLTLGIPIRSNPHKNRLLRALGSEEMPKADCDNLEVLPGDVFLICSDGFWDSVTEQDMLNRLATSQNVHQWMNMMCRKIEEVGNPRQDNYSAVCISVGQTISQQESRRV